jgi:hypothetical protein
MSDDLASWKEALRQAQDTLNDIRLKYEGNQRLPNALFEIRDVVSFLLGLMQVQQERLDALEARADSSKTRSPDRFH